MIGRGLGEIGLPPDQFWDMTWLEYEYALEAHRRRKAELLEGSRLLFTLVYNGLFRGENGPVKTPEQLIPLFTDAPVTAEPQVKKESTEEFLARMEASNFFQPSPPKA